MITDEQVEKILQAVDEWARGQFLSGYLKGTQEERTNNE
jgi:hypothetical protein